MQPRHYVLQSGNYNRPRNNGNAGWRSAAKIRSTQTNVVDIGDGCRHINSFSDCAVLHQSVVDADALFYYNL